MDGTFESEQPKSTKFFSGNLKKYLFEFSLLFLAVFLGFFADSLREENSEKQLAYELGKSFYEELKNDSVTILSKIDSRIKKERAIEYMITFLKDSSLQTSSKSLSINFLWATTVRTPIIFTPRTVILEQLKSSGSLRYFKNQRLQQLVGDLFVSIEYIHERQELEATVYKDYIEPIMINHMDFEFQRKLFSTGIFDRLASYESSDEYIPFHLSQPEHLNRVACINALSYYHTNNIKSTRMIPFEAYAKINAILLKELRHEFKLTPIGK
jgi:hypothetical protein